LTIPPPLALPKGKKRFSITSRKNKKKKSRKGKEILLSESVSSDADSVSLELTDASEDISSSQESDFLSSDSDLEKVIIYFNIY
jgi:hypothetical protein